jgi:hypothetical protein
MSVCLGILDGDRLLFVVGTILALVVLESLLLLDDGKSRLRTIENLRDFLQPREWLSVRVMASQRVSAHILPLVSG